MQTLFLTVNNERTLLKKYSTPGNKEVFDNEATIAVYFAAFAGAMHFISFISEGFGFANFFYELMPKFYAKAGLWSQVWEGVVLTFAFLVAIAAAVFLAYVLEMLIIISIEFLWLRKQKKITNADQLNAKINKLKDELKKEGIAESKAADVKKEIEALEKQAENPRVIKHGSFKQPAYLIVLFLLLILVAFSSGISKQVGKDTFTKYLLGNVNKKYDKELEDFIGNFDEIKAELEQEESLEQQVISAEFQAIIDDIEAGRAAKVEGLQAKISNYESKERDFGRDYRTRKANLRAEIADINEEARVKIAGLKIQARTEIKEENADEALLGNTYAMLQDSLVKGKAFDYMDEKTKSIAWAKRYSSIFSWIAGAATILACLAWMFFFSFILRADMKPIVDVSAEFFEASAFDEFIFAIKMKFLRGFRNKWRRKVQSIDDLVPMPRTMFYSMTPSGVPVSTGATITRREYEALKRQFESDDRHIDRNPSPPEAEREVKEGEAPTEWDVENFTLGKDAKGRYVWHLLYEGNGKRTKKYADDVRKEIVTFRNRLNEKRENYKKVVERGEDQRAINRAKKSLNRAVYNYERFKKYKQLLNR